MAILGIRTNPSRHHSPCRLLRYSRPTTTFSNTNREFKMMTLRHAIEELSTFIMVQADMCKSRGWSYKATENAPESFKDLKAQTTHKCIPIANYGCDTSIYDDNTINETFRFWHDVTHLELDVDFSMQGEYAVIDEHLKAAKQYGLSLLATRILFIDTAGQVEYYNKHSEFVQNQKSFLNACISKGINSTIKVKH